MQIAILNTSILTTYGSYRYLPLSLAEVKELLEDEEILSAVGHASTAQILTELLGREVPVNRVEFKQETRQEAIIFKLRGRPPEGKILTREEIEVIGFDFGVLTRLS